MTETKWGPWIDWHGGECPIPWAKAGEYQIRFSDSIAAAWSAEHNATNWIWSFTEAQRGRGS